MTNGGQSQSAETLQSGSAPNKSREIHKELSATIRRTMFMMLAYSAACAVIMAQTDVPFVLTGSGVKIPVINVAVSLKAFLVVGPLGLIVITAYLHLFLNKLDRITGLEEYDKQPFLFNFQDNFSRFLRFLIFYVVTPIVMVGFSWKSAVDPWWGMLTYLATMMVAAGMFILYQKPKLKLHWFIIIGIVALLGMSVLSFFLAKQFPRGLNLERAQLAEIKFRGINLKYGNFLYANLSKADLRGGALYKALLQEANLSEAFLSRADLRKADLTNADLTKADLTKATLRGANLHGATLVKANLEGADLREAILKRAILEGAILGGAIFWKANLVDTNLEDADLRGALLWGADLVKANLKGADLMEAGLMEADLHGATLVKANLKEADLRGADLRGAILERAILEGADLRGAILEGANLELARYWSVDQICKARSLYRAKLHPALKKQINEKCPVLLKKPQQR